MKDNNSSGRQSKKPNNTPQQEAIFALFEIFPLFHRWAFHSHPATSNGFTKGQWMILMTLFSKDSLSMGELAHMIQCSKEQCTRSVNPLVEKGYVKRSQNPENRRKVIVSLTRTGTNTIKKYNQQSMNLMSERLKNLSDTEWSDFCHSVFVLRDVLRQMNSGFPDLSRKDVPPFPPVL